jgi:hypothetical protein
MIFFQLPVLPERWLRGRHDRYVMQHPLWPHDPFVFCPVAHAAVHCYSSQSHMLSCIVHQISHMSCWRSDYFSLIPAALSMRGSWYGLRLLWRQWSPGWTPEPAAFDSVIQTLNQPGKLPHLHLNTSKQSLLFPGTSSAVVGARDDRGSQIGCGVLPCQRT